MAEWRMSSGPRGHDLDNIHGLKHPPCASRLISRFSRRGDAQGRHKRGQLDSMTAC